jgi:hypothetical protein
VLINPFSEIPGLKDYFAAQPSKDIGKALYRKIEEDRDLQSAASNLRSLFRRAYLYYFGRDAQGLASSQFISRGGDQGELAVIRVNHARSLVNTLQNLVLGSRIVWQPIATNSDYDSYSQTILATAVLEYYWRDRQIERYAARALEEAIVFGEAFLYSPWDEDLGDTIAPRLNEQGQPVGWQKSGDFKFINVSSWDVMRDPYKHSYDESDWLMVHTRVNRFNLAAKYPKLAEEILQAPSDILREQESMPGALQFRNTDDISVYNFYHKRGHILPEGRETAFVTPNCVLYDKALSYEEIPLQRVYAGEIFGTPFAYTSFFEILAIQELVDSLNSVIATNQTTFGTQMVAAPDGTVVSPESFGGMKLLRYPNGSQPPSALQLTKSPPEVFSYIKDLVAQMEQLMGLNSVARGEPQSGEQSGAALALLEAKAKQQSSVLEGAYLRFDQNIGSHIISTIRRKCPFPRRVAITGLANRSLERQEEYNGESFNQIHRVQVDIGNPLSQTPAGRKELADMYLQMLGPKMTPEQVEMVLDTGRIEPITQSLQRELLLIKSENESLVRGEQVQALADDDHVLHMREHKGEMANPEVRGNPEALQTYMAHMNEHWSLYTSMDPARLMALGQQPPPVLGPPPPSAGTPGPKPGPPEPPSVAPNAPEQPDLPSLPPNARPGLQNSPGITRPGK